MSENAGVDPRLAAAVESAAPPDEEPVDATQAAEDPSGESAGRADDEVVGPEP